MPTQYCVTQVKGIYWYYSEFRSDMTASLHAQNVLSILTLHFTSFCINYKVAKLACEVRSTGRPAYLLTSVSDCAPTRNLRSSLLYLLNVPAVRTQIARGAFSHAAPSVWNDLPVDIRRSESFSRFRTASPTHFFRLLFINWSRDCIRSLE